MKRTLSIIALSIIGTFILYSCGKSAEMKENQATRDSVSSVSKNETPSMTSEESTGEKTKEMEQNMTSTAAKVSGVDSLRKFIRTAQLEFKVANVFNSTHKIEDLTKSFGGFTTTSNLHNEIRSNQTYRISKDSSIEITEYVVKAKLEVRIPKVNLDTFLRSLAPMVVFINTRNVSAHDIQLDIMETELAQLRNQTFVEETKAASVNSTNGRVAALSAQADADAAKIERLMMLDKVEYSTVTIDIYQNSEVRYEKNANQNKDLFTPSFGERLWSSIKIGFVIIEELFLFIIKLWGLIVVGLFIFFITRFIIKRYKKKA